MDLMQRRTTLSLVAIGAVVVMAINYWYVTVPTLVLALCGWTVYRLARESS